MATSEAAGELPAPAASGGGKSIFALIAAMVALTIVAAAMGGGLGMKLAQQVEDAVRAQQTEEVKKVKPPRYTGPTHLKSLAPILTNLAAPRDVWVRMEASIIFEDNEISGEDVLAGEISEDFLAFLRTVSLSQLDGPSGMQHLREDLEDRARIRSEGRVEEVVIHTLVFQ